MKIALVSDTHNIMSSVEKACAVIEKEKPDIIIHLGDVMDDAEVMEAILGREVRRVPGNCDYSVYEPQELLIKTEHLTLLAVHGHVQGVKSTLGLLARHAREKGAQVAFYGHTHMADESVVDGVKLLNPGSAALPKRGQKPSIAMVTVGTSASIKLIHL